MTSPRLVGMPEGQEEMRAPRGGALARGQSGRRGGGGGGSPSPRRGGGGGGGASPSPRLGGGGGGGASPSPRFGGGGGGGASPSPRRGGGGGGGASPSPRLGGGAGGVPPPSSSSPLFMVALLGREANSRMLTVRSCAVAAPPATGRSPPRHGHRVAPLPPREAGDWRGTAERTRSTVRRTPAARPAHPGVRRAPT